MAGVAYVIQNVIDVIEKLQKVRPQMHDMRHGERVQPREPYQIKHMRILQTGGIVN
jgi:hypothetical protein